MRHFFSKKYLPWTIALGFILGIILGLLSPDWAHKLKILGDIYLQLLKMMVIPVMFLTVSHGIMQTAHMKELKKLGGRTIGLFVLMFVASCLVALFVALAIRPGQNFVLASNPVFREELTKPTLSIFLTNLIPENPIADAAAGKILPTMVFAGIFGIAAVSVGERAEPAKKLVESLMTISFRILDYIMAYSPIGVFSLMAISVASFGTALFETIGKYIATCYIACVLTFFIVMFLPVITYGAMPAKMFLAGLSKLWPVTLSTTSSAASLGQAIRISQEDFKLPSRITNFVLPLGNTINMCGGACSFTCLAIFAADFHGVALTAGQIAIMIIYATLINMSAPGIPGGGIILGASFLTMLGLPVTLMGLIAPIYRILDMVFTTMNVTGDVAASVIIAKKET